MQLFTSVKGSHHSVDLGIEGNGYAASPLGAFLNAKELAAALHRSVWFVCAMRDAGYRFLYGSATSLQHALAWLAANPSFRSTEYAKRRRKRARPQPGGADKSGAQRH